MPRGSYHTETGLLLRGKHGLVLRRDDGGEWRLDAPATADRMIGQRVRLEGVRDGFDLLAVTRIALAYGRDRDARRSWLKGLLHALLGR